MRAGLFSPPVREALPSSRQFRVIEVRAEETGKVVVEDHVEPGIPLIVDYRRHTFCLLNTSAIGHTFIMHSDGSV